MSVLFQVEGLHKSYGAHIIFNNASLCIGENQKVGVIGRNGAGKSTLFKLLVGEEEADSGSIVIHKRAHLGYLEQQDPYTAEETVLEFLARYTKKEEWRCGKVAARFQLKDDLLQARIGGLSGGYQMRVKLTAMLLREPNLLLLDEPTNYLDLSTMLLLEQFLKFYNGGFLIISHDREFLKNVCEETLEVDQGSLFLYPQPLEEYLEFKEEQLATKVQYNKNIEREQKHLQQFVDRFKAKATKAAQAKSKIKQIERLKKIEIQHPMRSVRIHIPRIEERKGLALRIEDMSMGYGEKIIAGDISLNIERGEHIAILGDNGQGKTTLLKTLAGELPCISGSFNWMANIRVGYYAQHVAGTLNPLQRVEEYLEGAAAQEVSKQDILKMASNFLFRENDIKKKISVLSGGERARLCLAGLLLNKRQVLLLDEPTNHLDFETVEALANALKECKSTLLFISHDRTFVNLVATGIIEVKSGKVIRYHHNYEDYVYHLEKKMLQEQDDRQNSPLSVKAQTKTNKPAQLPKNKFSNDELRIHREKTKKIENALKEYEAEKERLVKEFEESWGYSKERAARLTEVQKLIKEKENEWLVAQEQMESSGEQANSKKQR